MRFTLKLFFARNLDSLITIADEYIFHGKLEKIIEVTYSYREIGEGLYLNETLFEEYLGLNYPEYSLGSLLLKYKYKIGLQILKIESILRKTKKIPTLSRRENLRRTLFCESLEYIKNILEISILGADFEAEKGGYVLPFFKTDARSHIKKIEQLEKLTFGPKVSDCQDEFLYSYQFISANHQKKKNILSPEDRVTMNQLLNKIENKAKFPLIFPNRPKHFHLDIPLFHKRIERKDYRKIFDSVCEFYGLPQRTRITNAGSIYDGETYLEIPRNEAHANFSLERILKLIAHEIESHFINSHNGKILLGSFRGAKNLPKEEGLAVFMEEIFFGNTYDTIDTNIEYFFTTFVGEILSGEEFQTFMRIFGKEYAYRKSYEQSIQRAKRNYSAELPGVQHKDTVYFRGLSEVTKYLKNGGQFWKLFLGKVGFDDIDSIFLLSQLSERKQEIIFPVFMADLILYYLQERKKDTEFKFEVCEYYLYLKKKYWFIGIENFEIIEHIRQKEKELAKILKLLERLVL